MNVMDSINNVFFIIVLCFSFPADSLRSVNTLNFRKTHKKSAGIRVSSLIPRTRLSHRPSSEDKQCRSPRCVYIETDMCTTHFKNACDASPQEYTTMDIDHCLTVQQDVELARFEQAADKTLTQRLFIMFVARLPPVRLRNEQRDKNTKIILNQVYFLSPSAKNLRNYPFTSYALGGSHSQ